MTDKDVVDWTAGLWKVACIKAVEAKGNHKAQWLATIAGRRAIAWMFMLYPFLGQRRRSKIRDIVASWRNVPVSPQYLRALSRKPFVAKQAV